MPVSNAATTNASSEVEGFFIAINNPDQSYLLLAQVPEADKRNPPASGTLVLPLSDGKDGEKEEKKCMTVCSRWGEDCVIDPNRGRKCRRSCKEFAEECF